MVLTGRWMMIRNGAALAESYVRTTVFMVLAGTLLASCTSSVFSNPGGAANDSTGFSVGISGDTAIVGVRGSGTNNAGKALVYQRSGTAWALQATLTSSTPSNEAAFGWSVGISGDHAIVGALTDASLGYVSGAAYIFERNGGTWTQVARLVGDSAPETGLGQSVAISGDYAVVGAPLPPATTFTGPGHAFVYRRDQVSSWVLDATLSASDAVDFIEFGSSVSADGDKIVVGAKRGVVGGVVGGAAYVFRQSGGVWSQEAKLSASDAAYHDFFGTSVAVSADRILVGAKEDDDKGDGSGAAYVFDVTSSRICGSKSRSSPRRTAQRVTTSVCRLVSAANGQLSEPGWRTARQTPLAPHTSFAPQGRPSTQSTRYSGRMAYMATASAFRLRSPATAPS